MYVGWIEVTIYRTEKNHAGKSLVKIRNKVSEKQDWDHQINTCRQAGSGRQ